MKKKKSSKDIDKMLSRDIDRIFKEVFGAKGKGKKKA